MKRPSVIKKAKRLTSRANLVPVVKFLSKCGMIDLIKETIEHERGANALYDSVDALFLTAVAITGGSRTLISLATVWADGLLGRLAGWVAIPDNSTLIVYSGHLESGRYLTPETLNHQLREKIWRKSLKSGVSILLDP